jgi:hypothetical protein
MSDIEFSIANPDLIDSIWPMVSPLIQESNKYSGDDINEAYIKSTIANRSGMMILIHESGELIASVTVEKLTYPTGKNVLGITSASGGSMVNWVQRLDQTLQLLASEQDCSEIRIAGRPGWAKVLKSIGWEPVHVVLSRKVGE